jgi:hypothetical protein
MVRGGVNADDVDDLGRDLRALKAALPRQLEKASGEVAEMVALGAQDRAEGLGSTAAHVAPSIQADGETVAVGGSAYPMAAGAEFGGQGRPTTQQFDPYTSEGYFLYPSIRENEDQADELYADSIDDLTRRHDLR